MNDAVIVPVSVVLDDVLRALGHRSHPAAQLSDAEGLTVAVVAALAFQNHHARAVQVLSGMGSLPGSLSAARFKRRLHARGDGRRRLLEALGEVVAQGAACVIDSRPVPACRRVRARRCRKVRGAEDGGSWAAHDPALRRWPMLRRPVRSPRLRLEIDVVEGVVLTVEACRRAGPDGLPGGEVPGADRGAAHGRSRQPWRGA